jgi:hypothetical protein
MGFMREPRVLCLLNMVTVIHSESKKTNVEARKSNVGEKFVSFIVFSGPFTHELIFLENENSTFFKVLEPLGMSSFIDVIISQTKIKSLPLNLGRCF